VTKHEKQVLKALAAFVGFKAVLYGGIVYASRHYRASMAKYAGE
jgi:hypothetical protein